MTTLQLLLIGALLMGYYYFVLRRYNTLGFRIFSLCFFIGTSICYWWYIDYRNLKNVQQHGITTSAVVIRKTPDTLDFRYTDLAGKSVVRTQTGNISATEFAAVCQGQSTPILYCPDTELVYLKSTYRRLLSDTMYFLIFPGILFLIGIVCGVTLRKYRVHAHEGTIYEYVTSEDGKVVLDDARNGLTKALRNYSTFSKLLQIFDR